MPLLDPALEYCGSYPLRDAALHKHSVKHLIEIALIATPKRSLYEQSHCKGADDLEWLLDE
ncbi:hypothetical protein THOB06_50173 [Vibrio rotiferianus]|nr:hypothetical protein THOG10_50173 [Vibrio rotiferianus]CAH1591746.1 hypothetical protein THOB06_50173 [Vibrio rotiferianus]